MTRVLHVYRDHFSVVPGGIERHVVDLAAGLSTRFDVEVLAGSRSRVGRELDADTVPVHLVPEYGRFLGAPISPRLVGALRDDRFDLVHIHSPNPTAELGVLLARRGPVVVATYHADSDRGGLLQRAYERGAARSLARCDAVIATTEEFVRSSRVLRRVVSMARRPDVIPLGVDLDRFAPGSGSKPPNDPPVVLYVGRLRYYKGLDVLIEAMRHVDAELVIAGDGPERARLEALAAATLGPRQRFLGEVDDADLAGLYRSADVFCLPSTSAAEAFGLSAVEAMATALPVVTTELGTGTSVINRTGETGSVVAPGDPVALARALNDLVSDPEGAAAIGRAARLRAETLFDRRAMIDRTVELYERVLGLEKPA